MLRLAWYRHGDDARLQSQVPGGKGAAVWGSLGRPSRSPGLWNQSPGFDWSFRLPAMIDIKLSGRNSTTSPRNAPEPLKILSPDRGRRERRVLAAPAVSCAKLHKKTHTSIQVQSEHSGVPAQWLYGLCRALPGDEFVLSPSSAD